jgi:hypothetical protein
MSIASLTFRTWLRYLVPLTLLAALAFAVVAVIALRTGVPADAAAARFEVQLAWILAGGAWIFQLWLVAAVAPAVRAVAAGQPMSQLDALRRGARNLVRAAVPCALAIATIVIGGVALVVPGVVLFALLAMTGASDELGARLPAPLLDSIAVARTQLRRIAIVVAIVVVADLAIAFVAQLVLLHPLPKKPASSLLAPSRTFVRTVAAALIALSALPASAIAAIYARRRP